MKLSEAVTLVSCETRQIQERLAGLALKVQEKIESAQERIDASLESIKKEHERLVAEMTDEQDEGLPWDDMPELQAAILALSQDEATFTTDAPPDYDFNVKRKKHAVLQLLQLDPCLKSMHAKLRLREDVFWRNYFYRCAMLRLDHTRRPDDDLDSWLDDDDFRATTAELAADGHDYDHCDHP